MIAASGVAEKGIRTQRLAFAPLVAAHAPVLHALLDDWEVVKMLASVPWPVTLEDVEGYLRAKRDPGSDESAFTVMAHGEPIGICTVKKPGIGEPPRKMPRLGYWFGRAYWGRGYATEALAALAAYAFEAFAGEVIGAGVFRDNPASRRVLEKLGFECVGSYALRCRSRDAAVDVEDMNLTRVRWAASTGRA
jgi:8-oxo-dGTP diphosphatase